MNEYKKDIDSIEGKKFTMGELEDVMQKQEQRKNYSKAIVLATTMIFAFIIFITASPKNKLITITVHATSKEKVELSKKEITYKVDAITSSLSYSEEESTGILNLELFFNFEGEDIDEISLSNSENKIEREDIGNVKAYFVKTEKVQTSNYGELQSEFKKKDTSLWTLYDEKAGEAIFTTLVGEAYSVKYEEQGSEQYGLAINAMRKEDDTFSNEEIVLEVKIKYLDETVENRKIKIFANDDVLSGVQIVLIS